MFHFRALSELYHLFILVGITLFITPECASAETLKLLPQELHKIAEDRGCIQIDDFYDRPGMIEPPFVYGYMPGPKENSAAFWCQEKGEAQYYLMIMNKGKEPKGMSCPQIVPWKNYPRGLSIFHDRQKKLDDFIYIENPQKKAPEGIKMDHNGIRSYYDGITTEFYCHNGKWLVRQLD